MWRDMLNEQKNKVGVWKVIVILGKLASSTKLKI